MSEVSPEEFGQDSYAVRLANDSYQWYKRAAMRSRKAFRLSEFVILVVSASIPLTALFFSSDASIPAALGAVIVVVSGLRSIFHWQDNYLRFSGAREAVEAERRRYRTGIAPYGDPVTREAILTEKITQIEQGEMSNWLQVALERPNTNPPQSSAP
jgi:hypothetical protein